MSAGATAMRAAPVAAAASGWLVLAFDGVLLTLPQRSVRQVELVSDLKLSAAGEAPEAAWLLRRDDRSWPVYGLDGALRLVRPLPAARRVCVFFASGPAVCGLACDRVWSLASDTELTVEPVPGCMTGLPSPVTGLARIRDAVATITSAEALFNYLAHLKDGHLG